MPIGAEHRHLLDLERGSCCAPAARARCCSTAARPAAGTTGSCPTAACASTTSRSTTSPGSGCASRWTWPSSFTARRVERVVAFYPGPMGPTESLLGLRRVAGDSSGPTRCSPSWTPTWRRCSSTARAARRGHWLVPIDDCYRLVGADPHALEGAERRQAGVAGDRALLRRARPTRQAAPRSVSTQPGRRDQPERSTRWPNINRGQRGRQARRPSHTTGIKQGNALGNYEKMAGHKPDGTLDRRALHGHQPQGDEADRSRACPTCRRPRPECAAQPPPAIARPARARFPSSASIVRGAVAASTTRPCRRSCSRLRIEGVGAAPVRSILLDVQIQIAARRRSYDGVEAPSGCSSCSEPRSAGATTLRTLPWTRTTLVVPPSQAPPRSSLELVCTYDLEVTAARYLHALRDEGECRSSSCSAARCSTPAASGQLQTARIAWDREAEYGLPVAVWREAMDRHFPTAPGCASSQEQLRPAARLPRAPRTPPGSRRSTRSTRCRRGAR